MGSVMTLQFCMAAFAGVAAAMIVPPVRRAVPRWAEALIWLGLIVSCWMAITGLGQANSRFLTDSIAWGSDQIVNTTLGLMFAAFLGWMVEHRFVIANAVVTLAGADILALALVWSWRVGQGWQPRIALREWFEVPLEHNAAPVPVTVPYALDEWNPRLERALRRLGAAILKRMVPLITAPYVRAVTEADVIDVHAVLSAQSIGWYGPIVLASEPNRVTLEDSMEHEQDRLAS
jgi:hypothetical protein